jgi:hypothetical protein
VGDEVQLLREEVFQLTTELQAATFTIPFKVDQLEKDVQDIQQEFTKLDDAVQGMEMQAHLAPIQLLTPPGIAPPAVVVPSSQQPLRPAAALPAVPAAAPAAELAALRADVDDLQQKVQEMDHTLVSIAAPPARV